MLSVCAAAACEYRSGVFQLDTPDLKEESNHHVLRCKSSVQNKSNVFINVQPWLWRAILWLLHEP